MNLIRAFLTPQSLIPDDTDHTDLKNRGKNGPDLILFFISVIRDQW
jgi:hypothetical protein